MILQTATTTFSICLPPALEYYFNLSSSTVCLQNRGHCENNTFNHIYICPETRNIVTGEKKQTWFFCKRRLLPVGVFIIILFKAALSFQILMIFFSLLFFFFFFSPIGDHNYLTCFQRQFLYISSPIPYAKGYSFYYLLIYFILFSMTSGNHSEQGNNQKWKL